MRALLSLMLLVLPSAVCLSNDLSGAYSGSSHGQSITLRISQKSDGSATGTMSAGTLSMTLSGQVSGNTFSGDMLVDGDRTPFTATLSGKSLSVTSNGDTVTFTRSSGGSAAPAPVKRAAKAGTPAAPRKTAAAHSVSKVKVNGVALTSAQLAKFARTYGVQLPAGSYWYDRACGAWGVEGSPVIGVTKAGVEIGGPLKRNASNGNTGVFVNGRELPMAEIVALQQIGVQAVQGRWRLDAQGNVRKEGSSKVLGNLYSAAAAASGGGSGYHRKTAGGYIGSDGSTSYFFDPSSGSSVMIGQ